MNQQRERIRMDLNDQRSALMELRSAILERFMIMSDSTFSVVTNLSQTPAFSGTYLICAVTETSSLYERYRAATDAVGAAHEVLQDAQGNLAQPVGTARRDVFDPLGLRTLGNVVETRQLATLYVHLWDPKLHLRQPKVRNVVGAESDVFTSGDRIDLGESTGVLSLRSEYNFREPSVWNPRYQDAVAEQERLTDERHDVMMMEREMLNRRKRRRDVFAAAAAAESGTQSQPQQRRSAEDEYEEARRQPAWRPKLVERYADTAVSVPHGTTYAHAIRSYKLGDLIDDADEQVMMAHAAVERSLFDDDGIVTDGAQRVYMRTDDAHYVPHESKPKNSVLPATTRVVSWGTARDVLSRSQVSTVAPGVSIRRSGLYGTVITDAQACNVERFDMYATSVSRRGEDGTLPARSDVASDADYYFYYSKLQRDGDDCIDLSKRYDDSQYVRELQSIEQKQISMFDALTRLLDSAARLTLPVGRLDVHP
jgi:hypothetical protein